MNTARLSDLRNDLDIRLKRINGAVIAQLYDPLRNTFFDLSERGTQILRFWRAGTAETLKSRLAQEKVVVSIEDIHNLQLFFMRNNLVQISDRTEFIERQLRSKQNLHVKFSNLIFYKIRLGNPTRALNILLPFAEVFYSKLFSLLTVIICISGLYLLSKIPHEITHYLINSLTLQNGPTIALAMIIVKATHELGHAFQAKLAGSQVNGFGVMLLMGFPLPFTELTDSWRVSDPMRRLKIDAGGILAELTLAAWCIFAFAFLPDGEIRSLAFYVATISMLLSLSINLNPLMRFDGYFILSDLLNIKNLQTRSSAVARWQLREFLFKLRDPIPEKMSRGWHNSFILYAYSVWVYRFFLYLGIAVLAYMLLSKVIGVTVLVLQIFFFIVKPILSEFAVWKKNGKRILKNPRSWVSFVIFSAAITLFFVPMSHSIKIPARVVPDQFTEFVAPFTGKIDHNIPESGTKIKSGTVITVLSTDELKFDLAANELRQSQLTFQLSRISSLSSAIDQKQILETQLQELYQERAVLEEQQAKGNIVSDHSGIFIPAKANVHLGQSLKAGSPLGSVANFSKIKYELIVSGEWLASIDRQEPVLFYDGQNKYDWPSQKISTISDKPLTEIEAVEHLQSFGGSIPVTAQSQYLPKGTWFKVTTQEFLNTQELPSGIISGTAYFATVKISYATRVWRRVAQVLIREIQY